MKKICGFCNKEIPRGEAFYDYKTDKYYHLFCNSLRRFVKENLTSVKKLVKEVEIST